jgi:hypothetical protein
MLNCRALSAGYQRSAAGQATDSGLRSASRGCRSLLGSDNLYLEGGLDDDWLLPGIAPTGRKVEIPMLAVVTFERDKLASERIYWYQASVLVQVGLLDPAGLPVAGVETRTRCSGSAQQYADASLEAERGQPL